jgi:two-component system, chemotaxis family, sensor kinase CheA
VGRRKALIEKFRAITGERVIKLNRILTALEDEPGDEGAITEFEREVHTLKGEAKLLGFGALSTIAHKVEELLACAKAQGFNGMSDVVEVTFGAFDLIEGLRVLEPGQATEAPELELFLSTANRVITAASTAHPRGSGVPVPSVPEPVFAGPPPIPNTLSQAGGNQPRSTLHEAGRPSTEEPKSSKRSPSTGRRSTKNTSDAGVRVPMHRLELLADAADELMMSHSAKSIHIVALAQVEQEAHEVLSGLRSLASRLSSQAKTNGVDVQPSAADASSIRNRQELLVRQLQSTLRRLRETIAEESERVENIEVEVRELRLVPLERLFEAYPRAIRDMAREEDKRVKLEIEGSDVEIDQAVLERIEEPLVHLIRNAIDHGIESPDERNRNNKSPNATLRLGASQSGSRVVITVQDDGRGVDPDLVLQRAATQGLISADVAFLGPEQAMELLFAPGFSTRHMASELSGRGIGLDTVKSAVEAMGGVVQGVSELGRGTRFEISVPVSLVRAPVLVVELGSHFYGLPPIHVHSVIAEGDVDRINNRAIRVDGELMRLADMAALLGVPSAHSRSGTIVVIQQGSEHLAVRVDRVVTETHVVQKDLSPLVSEGRLATGTAVIGHGQLVVLVNVAALMHGSLGVARRPEPAPRAQKPRSRVLVIDDSELTRDILVNLVMRIGYDVVEAVDGADGLSRLAADPVDLVLTDLEMPVLDGFGLLEKMRATPQYRDLPVVVCSTRGSDEDKQRAADLGADAYVVKARFNEDELRHTLERFLGERHA